MKSDLNGTVSLVTGAARGIGRAIADRLAANGSLVVYTDTDAAAASAGVAAPSFGLKLDVTDTASIATAMDAVMTKCGRLDILVNNAGINTMAHRVTVDEFPREEWDRIMAVDLDGVF